MSDVFERLETMRDGERISCKGYLWVHVLRLLRAADAAIGATRPYGSVGFHERTAYDAALAALEKEVGDAG